MGSDRTLRTLVGPIDGPKTRARTVGELGEAKLGFEMLGPLSVGPESDAGGIDQLGAGHARGPEPERFDARDEQRALGRRVGSHGFRWSRRDVLLAAADAVDLLRAVGSVAQSFGRRWLDDNARGEVRTGR